MSSKNNSGSGSRTTAGGLGFSGVLTLIFITLKLLGKISWSWWWVLSPIWISAALIVLFLAIMFIVLLIKD